MTDEHFSKHIEYFFDDHKLTKTVPELKSKKVLKTYSEIEKALTWSLNCKEGTRFGLDYETNGLWRNDKYENLLVIGFGIATKSVGFYIELRYLSETELEKVKSLYKNFLDKHEKDIWVFNIDFELMATRKFLGPWSTYEFKDADVWRILYGDQIGYSKKVVENKRYGQLNQTIEKVNREQRWSLKYTAQKYLNVPSWDDEFEDIEKSFNRIFLGYSFTNIDDLMTNDLLSSEWKKLINTSIEEWKKFYTLLKRNVKFSKDLSEIDLQNSLKKHLPFNKSSNIDDLKKDLELISKWKKDKNLQTLKNDLYSESDNVKKKSLRSITSFLKKMTCTEKKKRTLTWKDFLDNIPEDYKSVLNISLMRTAFMGIKSHEEVYSHPEWLNLIEKYPLLEKEFITLIKDPKLFGSPYAVQPADIVGQYCILDSYYTVMIAEVNYEKDDFTPKGDQIENVAAKWANTEKLVNVFNANKSLGGLLNLYGLYKSNSKRDNYNDVQEKVRIFCNYILAKGYSNLLLNGKDLEPHKDEESLLEVFKTCLREDIPIHLKGELNFKKVTKEIFPKLYNPNEAFGWDDALAEKYLGEDLCEQFKDVLLDHKPSGFINSGCYNRAVNLHNELAGILEQEWQSQNLKDTFNWEDCKEYYIKSKDLIEAKNKLKCLDTFNLKNKTLEEVLEMNFFSYNCLGETITLNRSETLDVLKKQFFDVATATEVELGHIFEDWKDFRILYTLYNPKEFKKEIDEAGIFNIEDSIEDKVKKFTNYLKNIISNYVQPKLYSWENARDYSKVKKFTKTLNPNEDDMRDPLQATAYIDKVISEDLYSKYKISKKLMDTYAWFQSIDKAMMKDEKEWMLKYKKASPLSYRDWILDKGLMCKTYDNLDINDYSSFRTENLLRVCNISDKVDYTYYPIMSTCFKLYRKYDKLGQYLNGQLVDNDHQLLSEDSDGVPNLNGMTSKEKHSAIHGDKVKMFPRYEIMQKSTKRNSSGIHTVPSSSEVKGVICPTEDSFLVYTDISSMELRGIAAISKDQTMIDYFESGKDIKYMCPSEEILLTKIA